MKIFLIIGASATALLALMLVTILISPPFLQPVVEPIRTYLLHMAMPLVSRSINGSLEIGSLQGSLLSAPVIQDVVLRDVHGKVIGHIDEIRLRYDLRTLLEKRLLVHDVTLIRPDVTLAQEADGRLNLSHAVAPAATAPPAEMPERASLPIEIDLASLQLRDGHLKVQHTAVPGLRTVTGLQMQLRGKLTANTAQIELQHLQAHTLPAQVTLHTLQGTIQQRHGAIHIAALQFKTDATEMRTTGTLPGGSEPASLSLQFAPLDVGEIGRILDDDTLQGRLQLSLDVTGPPDHLDVRSQVQTPSGSIDFNGRVDIATTPPQYQGQLAITKLDVSALIHRLALQSDLNLHLEVEGKGLALSELQGHMHMQIAPSHVGNITINPSQLRIDIASQRLQIHDFQLDTSAAHLTMNGALDLVGETDLTYTLQANLPDLQPLLGIEPLDGTLHLQGQARGVWSHLITQGTLEAQDARYQAHGLRSLHIDYHVSQLATQPRATIQMQAQQAHVGTLPVAAVTLEATYDEAADQVHFTTQVQQSDTYDGALSGRLQLQDKRQALHMDTFQVRLDDRTWQAPDPLDMAFENGAVQINAFKLTHDEETLTLAGGMAGSHLNDVHLRASRIDLDFIRHLLTLPDWISGEATLETRLTGSLETPRLSSELTVLAPKRKSNPFARLHTTLHYAGQNLQGEVHAYQHEKEVIALHAQLPLQLSATDIPLAKRLLPEPVAVHLAIQQPDLAALQRSLPGLPALSGTVQGAIDLQGTYAHLNLDVDVALEQFGLPGTIEQVNAPLHLTSTLVMAPSVPALGLALKQGTLNPALHALALRVPTLDGNLPSQGQPPQSLHLKDLLAEAEGEWHPKGIQATLNTLKFQVEGLGLPPTDVAMSGQITPIDLELTRLQIQLPHSEIRAQGRLDLSDQGLNVAIAIPRLMLDELPLTLPDTLPKIVQGDLTVRGSMQAPELAAKLRYAEARINADLVVARQASPPEYHAVVLIEALDVSRFVPDFNGHVTTRMVLDGVGFTKQERQATLALDLNGENFAFAPDLTARLRADMTGASVRLHTLKVDSAPVTLDAQGALTNEQLVTLTYTLDLKDLTPLREHLDLMIAAKGRMTGEVTGPFKALQTRATLQLNDWKYMSLRGQHLRMDLTAQEFPATLQATVQARLDGLEGPALPSSALTLNASYRKNRGNFDVTMIEGPFEQTQLAGHVVLQDGQQLTLQTLRLQRGDWQWTNTKPVDIVHDTKGTFHLRTLQLRNGEQELRMQGRLQPHGPLAVKLQMQRVQLQPTVQALAPQAHVPDGRLNVDLRLSGTQKQPEMNATLRLDALQWQQQSLGNIEMTAHLTENTLHHVMRWRDGQLDLLKTQGSLGLGDAGKLAINIQSSDFDLAWLEPFSREILEIAGALNLDMRLAGTLAQPEAYGNLSIDHGSLQVATTGEPYRDVRCRIRFDGQRVNLEDLHVGSSSGSMQIKGALQTAGWTIDQLDLALDAKDFTAMRTPSMEAVVTADIEASGSLPELRVSGQVTVPRARIRIDELPGVGPAAVTPQDLSVEVVYGSGAGAQGTPENGASAARQQDSLPFLQADLNVDLPRNVWLQAPGTAIELQGKLDVTKRYNHPFAFGGDVAIVRGHATLFGKKFDLQSGEITFTGSEAINPLLNVTATHRVSRYTVYINLEGESQAPQITLSSDPELEQQDIISLLLFGRTSDRLTASEGSLSEQAQGAVASAVAGAAANAIGRALGIDSLSIRTGNSSDEVRVRAGQYITQDLFLSIEPQFGREGGITIGIEKSLSRHLLLRATGSELGESAIDFLWRSDH